jgi:lambda family phage portal protein
LLNKKRSYDAAGGGGRWPMAAYMSAPASQAHAAARIVSSRIGYLVENSPALRAIENAYTSNLIGDGPSLHHADPKIVAAWNRFWHRADAEGMFDLAGLLRRAAQSWVRSGEAFFVMDTADDGTLLLRLISPEQVDRDRSEDLGDGGMIVQGVEIDARGRRLAYWVLPTPPDAPFPMAGPSVRMLASDVVHIYEARHPGQLRGVSPLTSIATRAVELDQLEDAILTKARVSALFAGFVRDPSGDAGFSRGPDENLSLEPGVLRVIPADSEVTFTPHGDASTQPELARYMMRTLAAGAGVPYELMSGDLSQVNFSSSRLGLMEFRRRIKALRNSLIEHQALRPIFRRWALQEILAGRLGADPEQLPEPVFMWPGWDPIDPKSEVDADIAAIGARLKSRSEVIAARGRDPEEVNAELAADANAGEPGSLSVETSHA